MKKVLVLILFSLALVFNGIGMIYAQTTNTVVSAYDKNLEKVNLIGKKILEANKLPAKIQFKVSDKDDVNAYANINNEIYVFNGLLKFVETDEELAGVIAHEIGHIVNRHMQKQTVIGTILSPVSNMSKKPVMSKVLTGIGVASMLKLSRNDEFEADLTGADLMIGAGYNPLALISVLNKIGGSSYFDFLSSHPSGYKRLLNLYDYLSYNFPSEIQKGYNTESYKSFNTYINNILAQRRANPKLMAEYEKQQSKLRQARLKRATNIQKTVNPWEASYRVLESTVQILGQ